MNFEYVTQTLWKSTEVVPLRPQGSLWVCPNKYWIELVRRLCPEELPSKELGVLGWKGAWKMCFDSNKCIFLISDLWMKKKSIMCSFGWWDEKKRRWGREAWQGAARTGKHLGGKAAMGTQCWRDRQSQSQDRSPPAAVGGQTSPAPAAVSAQAGLCTANS